MTQSAIHASDLIDSVVLEDTQVEQHQIRELAEHLEHRLIDHGAIVLPCSYMEILPEVSHSAMKSPKEIRRVKIMSTRTEPEGTTILGDVEETELAYRALTSSTRIALRTSGSMPTTSDIRC